jgi:hypothetical protein
MTCARFGGLLLPKPSVGRWNEPAKATVRARDAFNGR